MASPDQTHIEQLDIVNCAACPLQIKCAEAVIRLELSGSTTEARVYELETATALVHCNAGGPTISEHRKMLGLGQSVPRDECATKSNHRFREEFYWQERD